MWFVAASMALRLTIVTQVIYNEVEMHDELKLLIEYIFVCVHQWVKKFNVFRGSDIKLDPVVTRIEH